MPGAACPGVPPTGPPGLGQVVGGQRAHQLMLLLQLGLPVLAPLVPSFSSATRASHFSPRAFLSSISCNQGWR